MQSRSSLSSSSSPPAASPVDVIKSVATCYLLMTSLYVATATGDDRESQGGIQKVPVIDSCIPPPEVGDKTCREQPLTVVEMTLNARSLLYGKVINTYRDKRVENYPRMTVFTAEMQVYCVIKGEITKQVVNISEAGYVPGRCYKSMLEKDQEYLVVVYPMDGLLCTVDDEILATEENVLKVSQACDLDPRYPIGVTEVDAVEKKRKRCPKVLRHPQCLNDDHYTTTTDANHDGSPPDYGDYFLDEGGSSQDEVGDPYDGLENYVVKDRGSRTYARSALGLLSATLPYLLRHA